MGSGSSLSRRVGPLSLVLASAGVMVLTATAVQSCRGRLNPPDSGLTSAAERQAVESLGDTGFTDAGMADVSLLGPTMANGDVRYAIQPGDTLSGIAARFGVSPDALVARNHLSSADDVAAGDVLVIGLAPSGTGPLFAHPA